MNNTSFFIYLLIVAGSTYLIRAIPFSLIRKKINNTFINSFLTYIPYAVLAAMTFPGALYVTGTIYSAIAGLAVSLLVALKCKNLTIVAVVTCLSALIVELFVYLL